MPKPKTRNPKQSKQPGQLKQSKQSTRPDPLKQPKQPHAEGFRVRWTGLNTRPERTPAGGRPFYKLETLAAAVESLLRRGDCFLTAGARELLGPSGLSSLSFDFFRETEYQVVFRMTAANLQRKRKTLAFVAARNEQEFSTLLRAENVHLQKLYERVPRDVVRPYRGGLLYLPDRYRRKGHGRKIYAYLTEWLPDWTPLTVANPRQLAAAGEPPHVFSLENTALIRRTVLEILWRVYDPAQGTAIALDALEPGDFAVWALRGQPPKLRLTACRKMRHRVRPVAFLAQLIDKEWLERGRRFPLPPEEPEQLVDLLRQVSSAQTAQRWIRQLAEACASNRVSVRNKAYVEALASLVLK